MKINALIFASTDKVLTKYTKPWDEIKYVIKTIHGAEAGEYIKHFMKI